MAASRPLVSVLTPVYNGERFLSECIESVLAQSYQAFEYIIVNNCSVDRSRAIAEEYARRDSRIRVVDNATFLSSAQNHNACLREISGDSRYVKFVHADDWLYPECLSRMVALAEEHPSVVLVSAYRLDGDGVSLTGLPHDRTVFSGAEICRRTLRGGFYVFGSPTSILLRAPRVRMRDPYFEETRYRMHFDTASCYEELRHGDFGFVHQVLTGTRRHGRADSSRAQRLNTYAVEVLRMVRDYGPIYFDPTEYAGVLRRRMDGYYRFLARNIGRARGREFWDYHRAALAEFGERRAGLRIAAAAVRLAGEEMGAPARKAVRFVGRCLRAGWEWMREGVARPGGRAA